MIRVSLVATLHIFDLVHGFSKLPYEFESDLVDVDPYVRGI